jgi:hypothetical protein
VKVVSGRSAVKTGENVRTVFEVTVTVAVAIQLAKDTDGNDAGTGWSVFRSKTATTVPGIMYVVPERQAF